MSFYDYYYGCIKITDGKDYVTEKPSKIVMYKGKLRITIKTLGGERLSEIKVTRGNHVVEWEKYGAFHRGYDTFRDDNISAPVVMKYHPASIKMLHGLCYRLDQKLFGKPGKCRTYYSRGRLLRQEFRYKNGRLAYRLNASDKYVLARHDNGKVAAVIGCAGKGFSTRSGDRDSRDTHTCRFGEVYFKKRVGRRPWDDEDIRKHDYSKDGNCSFNFYNRNGKIRYQGEYANRQKVGEWVEHGRHVYYIRGVAIAKRLWDTPPEKLKVKTILRQKNAQMRAALIARVGLERFSRECRSETINETRNGMKLMEFPVKVDDGNGDNKSKMRILQVTCPSTRNKYYLNVPDFVWDHGKRTRLDTCEKARQWTFGIDDPRKNIKFAIET